MSRFPARLAPELVAAILLLFAGLCAGCAGPRATATGRHATPTATVSPLAHTALYASMGTRLVAMRASDGQELWHIGDWTWPIPSGGAEVVFGPGAPVADGGVLLATSPADHTGISTAYAFNPADGSVRWSAPLAGCVTNGPPLVANGVVYIASTGHANSNLDCGPTGWVYALREADGAVLWRKPFADVVYPSLSLADGVLVVMNDNYPAALETAYLTGLRASDGAQLWQVQRPSGGGWAFPAATDGVAVLGRVLGNGSSGQAIMVIEAFRVADGAYMWRDELSVRLAGSIEGAANGLVYAHSDLGELYALRLTDGSVAWRYVTADTRSISPLALVGGDLYFGDAGSLVELDATSGMLVRGYTPTPPGSPTRTSDDAPTLWTQPVLAGGTIFVAGAVFQGHFPNTLPTWTLYAFDQASGRVMWQKPSQPGAGYSALATMELPAGGPG